MMPAESIPDSRVQTFSDAGTDNRVHRCCSTRQPDEVLQHPEIRIRFRWKRAEPTRDGRHRSVGTPCITKTRASRRLATAEIRLRASDACRPGDSISDRRVETDGVTMADLGSVTSYDSGVARR